MNDEGPPDTGVPAGWYDYPAGSTSSGTHRYWDGNDWVGPPQPKPPEDKGAGALVVFGYLTAFLLPIVGFILGIILLVRRQTNHGLAVFLISIVVGFVACSIAFDDAEEELNRDMDRLEQDFNRTFK